MRHSLFSDFNASKQIENTLTLWFTNQTYYSHTLTCFLYFISSSQLEWIHFWTWYSMAIRTRMCRFYRFYLRWMHDFLRGFTWCSWLSIGHTHIQEIIESGQFHFLFAGTKICKFGVIRHRLQAMEIDLVAIEKIWLELFIKKLFLSNFNIRGQCIAMKATFSKEKHSK